VLWIAYESFRSKVPVAGAVFLALLGLSPFVLEMLSFARSSAGFYLVALLILVPLAFYGLVGPPPTVEGLLKRWVAAGVLFGLCALCRSGALLMVPGLALLLALSVARMPAAGRRERLRRGALAVLTLVLFMGPFLAMRQPEHHDVWAGVWEGLGDFDRTKGHSWSDPVAEERVRREGAAGLRTPEATAILRAEVLDHVRDDPGWYAGILARRLFATLTQSRLWPTVRSDGLWMTRSTSPNEGSMDKYYADTTTVDFLGFGPHQVELPVALILLPTVGLLAWAGFDRRWRPAAMATLVLMAAALPLPVLISTAGGAEPQAFALAYGLGFALMADALWDQYGYD
jgi:4-amino-4-deoxy-L-arabinose transferase-like glycosyltransferase